MQPRTVAAAGGTAITITGSSFGERAVIKVRGVVWTNFTQSHTQILLYAPPGVGITNTLQVLVAGVSGNIQNLVYFAPIINSINPPNGPTKGELPRFR